MIEFEELQEAITLTVEQESAWKYLERAVKKCKAANIYFYHVLETLGALNGDNVDKIICTECDPDFDILIDENANSLQQLVYPTLQISESFADDTHWVRTK